MHVADPYQQIALRILQILLQSERSLKTVHNIHPSLVHWGLFKKKELRILPRKLPILRSRMLVGPHPLAPVGILQ
jgi:hypothetical protein